MLSWPLGSWTLRLLVAWFTLSHRNLFNCCSPILFAKKKTLCMPATLIDIDLHIVEQICLEKSQRLPCCFQHRWHPKKETILSWSLVTGKRQCVKDTSGIQMLRAAMTRQQTWYTKICKSGFTDMFSPVYFFLGGGSSHRFCPVILSLPETRGPCPLGFFCQVFMFCLYHVICLYLSLWHLLTELSLQIAGC